MQNYKVFINNSLIFFGRAEGIPPYQLTWSDFQAIKPEAFPSLVNKIESFQDLKHYIIDTDDLDAAFCYFSSFFKSLKAAGGLVLNDKNDILLIQRFNRWDFPKGKVEANESVEEAAIREVIEETGVQEVMITKELPKAFHIYDYADKWILKETCWYLMHSNYTGMLQPQLEEEIIAAKWIPLDFLDEYLNTSYPGIRELVEDSNLLNK